jgi:hypothetical protein
MHARLLAHPALHPLVVAAPLGELRAAGARALDAIAGEILAAEVDLLGLPVAGRLHKWQ